ncbi:hypothetical protein CEXT_769641 [Caerostris extrusa]|uniref:Uncharacterized protein n=1 Tax=Caerostris extrusa TaxID=172846 RepID=A0AAV4U3F2_CAEEX|nr:hypothetical protein CEXT_769641 [Caerostris extrusa]
MLAALHQCVWNLMSKVSAFVRKSSKKRKSPIDGSFSFGAGFSLLKIIVHQLLFGSSSDIDVSSDRAASGREPQIATPDSEIDALAQLSIPSISNNQIRTISTNQIPPKLTHLYLADNPFHCDCQMLPFLQFLNSTKVLTTDEDLCTPSHNGRLKRFNVNRRSL